MWENSDVIAFCIYIPRNTQIHRNRHLYLGTGNKNHFSILGITTFLALIIANGYEHHTKMLLLLPFQFSHSVMSNSWQPHGLQHSSLPCPSPTPRACSNSCPSSHWCHPTISSSVVPFSSCLQWLFQWVSYSHQVARVLELQLQLQTFQWIFKTDFL